MCPKILTPLQKNYKVKSPQSAILGSTSEEGEKKFLLALRMNAEGVSIKRTALDTGLDEEVVKKVIAEPENQVFIKQFRESYMMKVMEVPVANKRVRIDGLEASRLRCLGMLEKLTDDNKADRTEACNVIRKLVEVLSSAREEMEKKPFILVQQGEFGQMSDDELFNKRDELLQRARKSLKDTVDVSGEVNDTEEGMVDKLDD